MLIKEKRYGANVKPSALTPTDQHNLDEFIRENRNLLRELAKR